MGHHDIIVEKYFIYTLTKTVIIKLILSIILPFLLVTDQWKQVPGQALDIGVGADGTVCVVGINPAKGGFAIYKLTKAGWQEISGQGGTRVAVDPKGNPWVVTGQNEIYRYNGKEWKQVQGKARDIAIGADGTVCVLGGKAQGGGYSPYKWDGFNWKKLPGAGTRIAVDPKGNPWVVNKQNFIYRHDGKKWHKMAGKGQDIAIGKNGTIGIIGTKTTNGGYAVYLWDEFN